MKLEHYDHDNRARFITFCTYKKLPLLTNNKFRKIIIQSICEARKAYYFKLLSYVIMPEHIHMVIIPAVDVKVGSLIGDIKKASSKSIHRLLKDSGSDLVKKLTGRRDGKNKFAFWQRRCYDHNCRTEESVWEKVNYCHYNPVKRGLVKSPGDWRWSSYRWYEGGKDVMLDLDEVE
jgi:putative transposase